MFEQFKQKIKENRYKIYAGASFVAAGYLFYCYLSDDKNIKLSSFLSALEKNQLDEVVVQGQQIWFRSFASQWYHSSIGNYPVTHLFEQLRNTQSITFSCESQNIWLYLTLPIVVPTAAFLFVTSRMHSNVGENIHQQSKKTNTIQKFEHFHGGQKLKEVLKQTIKFMQNPQKYKQIGIRMRRGIILYGPPGTGKTMLARIIANEAQLPFIASSGSQFQQIFVGVGPKRIRSIFKEARQSKKGCVIFIDQFDAIGSRTQSWQTKEQRSTINQLLSQIDGFQQNQNIFIIAATNNLAAIDPALLRPGRFDLKLYIPDPNDKQRAGILQKILLKKKVPHKLSSQDLLTIGEMTQNYTGAHLQNLINESLYASLRHNEDELLTQRVIDTFKTMNNRQSNL